MELYCPNCDMDREILVQQSGPYLKATCQFCLGYIKFLNHDEKRKLEMEEDDWYGTTTAS